MSMYVGIFNYLVLPTSLHNAVTRDGRTSATAKPKKPGPSPSLKPGPETVTLLNVILPLGVFACDTQSPR